MPVSHPRPPGRRVPAAVAAPLLAALLLVAGAALPIPVGAAPATMVPACSGVNLRTGATTAAAIKARLAVSARLTVTGTVSGTSWRAVCAGSKSGSSWYRITAIDGATVRSLYGITALFAATGVLTPAPAATTIPPPSGSPVAPASTDALGGELMRLVNLERAALGRPSLVVDAGLAAIARDATFTCPTDPSLVLHGRAADMAARGYFGHTIAGCYRPGTTTPYGALDIVRSVFGYAEARSEILHWNMLGTVPTTYAVGCDQAGGSCLGGTTTVPETVAMAQRSFMGSTPHRTSQLAAYQRFGCGSATVPGSTPGSSRTYFACLFANGPSAVYAPPSGPAPTAAPAPSATPIPAPAPVVGPASTALVPACDGVNLRTDPATTAPLAARLPLGTMVGVDATVAGTPWSTECGGAKAGASWYRVTQVNGTPVAALYGVAALYAATGVLTTAPTTAVLPGSGEGLSTLGATVTFFGRGYGHGVGLSQHGARGRALAGQGAEEILAHYYPGTTIGALAADSQIRVLLLGARAVTAASPLVVVGNGDGWTIDGIPMAFPAGARLRLFPPAPAGGPWRALVDAAGVALFEGPVPAVLRLAGLSEATTFQVPARSSTYDRFRGALRILATGSKVDVVNELSLETYLRGVVPAEMPSAWPAAARTAQTIAARSFAAYRLRPGVGSFDVYDDTRSQVYRGVRVETAAADATIAATAGQILAAETGIADALYHSTGGGATESNENAFVAPTGARVALPVPYLRGSPDRDAAGVPYDAAAPYATWQSATYSLVDLSAIFAADPRTNVGTLTALDLRDRGVSGRLASVTLVGSAGTRRVSGGVFTTVFNAHRPGGDPPLRSTLLDLAPIP